MSFPLEDQEKEGKAHPRYLWDQKEGASSPGTLNGAGTVVIKTTKPRRGQETGTQTRDFKQ